MIQGKEIGIFGGRFTPLHNGHVGAILRAAEQVDYLFVILSYAKTDPIHISKRYKWLKSIFARYDDIHVIKVEREKILETEEEWLEDSANIRKCISNYVTYNDRLRLKLRLDVIGEVDIDKVFVGSNDHGRMFDICYPEAQVYALDPLRSDITISGTEIRGNIFKYWEFLPKFVRKDYAQGVVVRDERLRNILSDRFSTVKMENISEKYLNGYDFDIEDLVLDYNEVKRLITAEITVARDNASYDCNKIYFLSHTDHILSLSEDTGKDIYLDSTFGIDEAIEFIKNKFEF